MRELQYLSRFRDCKCQTRVAFLFRERKMRSDCDDILPSHLDSCIIVAGYLLYNVRVLRRYQVECVSQFVSSARLYAKLNTQIGGVYEVRG